MIIINTIDNEKWASRFMGAEPTTEPVMSGILAQGPLSVSIGEGVPTTKESVVHSHGE